MYQVLELKIVKCLNISLFCLLLCFVQLPPEAIGAAHIQYFIRVYLPCIAAKGNLNISFSGAFINSLNKQCLEMENVKPQVDSA